MAPLREQFPDIDAILAHAHVVSLPMKVKFRGVLEREVMLLNGPHGWGEFSPFLEYDDAEAAPWLASGLEAAYLEPVATVRTRVPVNATVPAVAGEDVPGVLARFGADLHADIHTVKIKVAERGQTLAEDLARVAKVRELLPDARLRVDANMGWTQEQAIEALRQLEQYRLEYAEQPVAGVVGLARLREELAARRIDMKIAADESIRKAEDPLEVARLGAADLMVIKAAPLGGVRRALALVEQAGLPAVVSSALDSSVGIAHGVRLAAALPRLEYACGLGTVALMAGDVSQPSLRPLAGSLGMDDAEQAARSVQPLLLERYAAAPERRTHWFERARRVFDGEYFSV